MTADFGTQAQPAAAGAAGARFAIGTAVGDHYLVRGAPRRGPLVEVYDGVDTRTAAPIQIRALRDPLVATSALRERFRTQLIAAARVSHERVAAVIGGGVHPTAAGDVCYVVTEPVGAPLAAMIARKRQSGAAGIGGTAFPGLVNAILDALAAAHDLGVAHGALTEHAIAIDGDGRIKVCDFGVGALVPAAVAAKAVAAPPCLAPEDAASGAASPLGDVFSLGHLMYVALVGEPLRKGGRRPSEFGVPAAVDTLVARCVGAADKRPQGASALRAELATALESAPVRAARTPTPIPAPSLAQSMASAAPGAAVAAVDDDEERWLITKGRLDYGPFTLAHVIEQIRSGEIRPGNTIVDNYTGNRCPVEDHPQLGALVDEARQRRDDQRRAEAEMVHAKQDKRRGFLLYLLIFAAVVGLGGGVYLVVSGRDKPAEPTERVGLTTIGEGDLAVKISAPKTPTRKKRRSSGRRSSSGGAGGGDEVLDLDLSEAGGSERLDNDVINGVIQGRGRALGGCLMRNRAESGGSAQIEFIIAGPTGRVTSAKVNGKRSGGLYSCINGVLRSMKFPTVNGPRTRAEFEMSL